MGQDHSHADYQGAAVAYYETSLRYQCLQPDIGIDDSLLQYSDTNSNAVLRSYSSSLVNAVPDLVSKYGAAVGSFTPIPNAVGIGALVISMILELAIKGTAKTNTDSYSLLQRVFGQEKASSVRDTMSEYLKRHVMFMHNQQLLRYELNRLEAELSSHLTILKNSLLHDRQMSSRGLKIWVNGASFHVQMLIHEARLTGQPTFDKIQTIRAAINLYLQDLNYLLQQYKSYKISNTHIYNARVCNNYYPGFGCSPTRCFIRDRENRCEEELLVQPQNTDYCGGSEVAELYINHLFSNYPPILTLRGHFSNVLANLNTVCYQHFVFSLPYSY